MMDRKRNSACPFNVFYARLASPDATPAFSTQFSRFALASHRFQILFIRHSHHLFLADCPLLCVLTQFRRILDGIIQGIHYSHTVQNGSIHVSRQRSSMSFVYLCYLLHRIWLDLLAGLFILGGQYIHDPIAYPTGYSSLYPGFTVPLNLWLQYNIYIIILYRLYYRQYNRAPK